MCPNRRRGKHRGKSRRSGLSFRRPPGYSRHNHEIRSCRPCIPPRERTCIPNTHDYPLRSCKHRFSSSLSGIRFALLCEYTSIAVIPVWECKLRRRTLRLPSVSDKLVPSHSMEPCLENPQWMAYTYPVRRRRRFRPSGRTPGARLEDRALCKWHRQNRSSSPLLFQRRKSLKTDCK